MRVKQPSPHHILSQGQREFLSLFSRLPDAGSFYLTGGTALAEFYFGHRLSFDLDLFTTETGIIRPFALQLEAVLPREGIALRPVRRLESFAEYEATIGAESIRVQLAYDSPFRFASPISTPLGPVNDYQDLVVDKMLAFFGRAEPRDAVDLFFILRENDFWELAGLAAQKDAGFDLYWMATALIKASTYPEELERWPVQMLQPFLPRELKEQFIQLAHHILSRIAER